MNPLLKIIVEAGPLVVFFSAFAWAGIFVATALAFEVGIKGWKIDHPDLYDLSVGQGGFFHFA